MYKYLIRTYAELQTYFTKILHIKVCQISILSFINLFTHLLDGARTMWVGATDEEEEGTWVWAPSGRNMEYTKWWRSQFSSYNAEPTGSREENCLAFGYQYGWFDKICRNIYEYICEYDTC